MIYVETPIFNRLISDCMVFIHRSYYVSLVTLCLCFLPWTNAQEWSRLNYIIREDSRVHSIANIEQTLRSGLSLEHNNPDSAIYLYRRAFMLSREKGSNEGMITSLLNIGHCYVKKGDYNRSILFFKNALAYSNKTGSKKLLYNSYCDLAVPYYHMGDYKTAANLIYQAIENIKQYDPLNYTTLVLLYSNLSGIFMVMDQPDQAIYYQKAGAEIAREQKLTPLVLNILINTGTAYLRKNDLKKARQHFNKAIMIAKEQKDAEIECLGNAGIGETYTQENNPAMAMIYLRKAQSFYDVVTPPVKVGIDNDLAHAYYLLDDYSASEQTLLRGLYHSEQHQLSENSQRIYHALIDVYAAMGAYRKAFDYQKKYHSLRDSILNKEKNVSINQLEVKYRTAEKDKQLAQKQLLLTSSNALLQKKNLWIGAISSGLLLLAISFTALYRNNRHKQKLQTNQMHTLQQEQEISNLKSMITGEEKERSRLARELHDGIMVQLSTVKIGMKVVPEHCKEVKVSEYFATQHYQQLLKQMEDVTTELRQTAHNLMPDMLLQAGLADAIFYFCKKLEQATGLEISFQQHGEIPRLLPEFEISTYRMVQELFQNIIKHAQATKAIVQLTLLENSILTITVEDNGKGFDLDKINKNAGMGLKSIHTRVRALSGIMDLRSKENDGATIYLEFDILSVINKDLDTA